MSLRKIVVIGPESTGKSTLSQELANTLNTVWVPEYAREYLLQLGRGYNREDLLTIAKMQLELEDALSIKANEFLICDTDLYVHKVWSEHSFDQCHAWILEQIAVRPYDLYLLTDIDMPWEPDALREHGTDSWRNYFYQQYKDIVINSRVPWAAVKGNKEERLQAALEAIRQLL